MKKMPKDVNMELVGLGNSSLRNGRSEFKNSGKGPIILDEFSRLPQNIKEVLEDVNM